MGASPIQAATQARLRADRLRFMVLFLLETVPGPVKGDAVSGIEAGQRFLPAMKSVMAHSMRRSLG
jgi:hypothetical protein